MERERSIITIEDVHNLVDMKNRDPNIAPKELYRQIDKIHPNYGGEMWSILWFPLLLSIIATLGMSFIPTDGNWNRLAIISFIIASLWGIYLLRKYDKTWWWIPLLAVTILYVIYADSLSLKDLMKYITDLL